MRHPHSQAVARGVLGSEAPHRARRRLADGRAAAGVRPGRRALRVRRTLGLWSFVAIATAVALPPAAYAEPSCQRGVLTVWARGSSQNFTDKAQEFNAFKRDVGAALGTTGHAFVQLGNIDGDGVLENGEYPAVGGLGNITPGYFSSRGTGRSELIAFLNRRAGLCPGETYILGGFSQGADVVGDAVLLEGYGDINDYTRRRIGTVALYGDPSHYAGRGVLPARPLPSWLTTAGRIGSWCDVNDMYCRARDFNFPWGNSHGWIYAQRYIPDTAGWIAERALSLQPQP